LKNVRILIAATGIVLPACASVPVRVPYDVSAPTVIPDGVLGRIDSDGATTIYMEGLDLKIAVQNQRSYERGSRWEFGLLLFPFPMIVPTVVHEARPTENEELSPLVVFLSFDSREEGTLFYPDRVTVDPDDGTVQSMEAFRGPADEACGGVWAGSESRRKFELPRGQTTCFVLQFPMQSSPDVHFGLHLAGLTRLGEPTPPVELRFIKFKGHSAD
jgi:hypothetical protein